MQLGGDEVDISCWSNDAEIEAWNVANGHAADDLTFIYALYMTSMMTSMRKVGFLPLWYAETFGPLNATGTFDFVASKIMLNGWDAGTPGSLSAALTSGAKAIVTSYCFLMPGETCPGFPQVNGDQVRDDALAWRPPRARAPHASPHTLTRRPPSQPNWWYNYGCELQNASLFSPAARPFLHNIVGGGPARWGEATDPTNLFAFTYPAVMGAAEKLWSTALLTNGSYYGTRQEVFADHRCVLIRRGVPVQPTSAYSWSCDFEWEPPYPPRTPLAPNPANSSWGPPSASLALPALTSDEERELRVRRLQRGLNEAAGVGNSTRGRRGVAAAAAAAAGARRGAAAADGGAGRGAAALVPLGATADDFQSLWPIPASYTPVPCGGAPAGPAWTTVCTGCAAVSSDCPYLAHGDARSLDACKANCLGMAGCNAINFNPSEPDCVFRRCNNASAIHTTPDPAYDVYAPQMPTFPVGLAASFKIVLDASVAGDAYMEEVARRMLPQILWHPRGAFDRPVQLATLTVSVSDTSVRQIQAGVDESYSLGFAGDCAIAVIEAQTIFGARHALETFSQMVAAERLSGSYSLASYYGLFNVSDAPRFDTRGLMVDSARHWLNPNLLLSLMDALSYVKMNKLEVGFGIDWAYTIESDLFPNLTDNAYGPRGTHQFSRETIRFLVHEANLRGVRLVPFVEVVGHDALCGYVPYVCWCSGQPKGNLPHPLHAETWAFFDAYWAELKTIFPETYINVGGDEVDASCYENDPEIGAWNVARGHGYNDTSFILGEYYRLQTESLNRAGFKPTFYAEAWGALNSSGWNDTSNALFDGWDTGTPGSVATQLEHGAHVIISSYCFLAPTQGCPDNLPGGLTPDQWTNRACEIQNKSLFPEQAWPFLGNLHGGHPARWGEQTDGTNIFQFTFPALMGAAEVLWSPFNTTSDASISRSLAWRVVRCIMVRRGVPVDPRSGGGDNCDVSLFHARRARAPRVRARYSPPPPTPPFCAVGIRAGLSSPDPPKPEPREFFVDKPDLLRGGA